MPKANEDKVKILSDNLFPVVGIGASAGGLDAFKKLVKTIPGDSGMAYIIVQHLDPTHESILTEILQRVTEIPVHEITNNISVEADHIYIIPSNKLLNATDGILQLTERPAKGHPLMAIDLFFKSLAEVHQSHAIGVILSGTGTDGTIGLKAIKDAGGTTIVQEQQSASHDAMPQSAVDAGIVDYILSPEEIPAQLIQLYKQNKGNEFVTDGTPGKLEQNEFKQVYSLLRTRKNVDFTYYKQTTLRRRIARRIALSMKTDLTEYLAFLKKDDNELDLLYQDLLIPVTQFFRDAGVFEHLCKAVFPSLLHNRDPQAGIRVWIAGCSTGEEAYSMIMCMHEYLGDKAAECKVQVFATDISEPAITKARTGTYKKHELTGLSAGQIQKYFTRVEDEYRINKTIRDCCVFAYHNYLKDPPFAKIDLISCRNSLIYLEPFLQKIALTTFHYALIENGFLLLGKSETTGPAADLFNAKDKNSKVYTRKGHKGKFLHVIADRKEEKVMKNNSPGKPETIKDDFQKSADDVLLSMYAPPGVIVNSEHDIVQFRGATGLWLESSPGKPSLNVLKMAREGLSFELRNALYKVQKTKKTFQKNEIPMRFMGEDRLVSIEVVPLANTIEQHYLILFKDVSAEVDDQTEVDGSPAPSIKGREVKRNEQLQKELAQLKEDMRSITQDQEAMNEELQSANEELLSGSEELQSLNEELETSKEEIQTSNEELIIVNQELYDRNEQLNLSRLYAESIVSTIREPLIVLNKDLHVKTANTSFCDKFHIAEEDISGKSFFEIGKNQWNIPRLRKMLEEMLPEKKSIVDFEVSQTFQHIGRRVMQLNASRIIRDNIQEQTILLAIEDITEKVKSEKELKLFSSKLEKEVKERTAALHKVNADLQRTNFELEQFAYIASHDLQEPLRKIKTFCSLLLERHIAGLSDTGKELLTKITASSDRMSTLIHDVLNFSNIVHGDAAFKKTDLNTIFDKTRNDFDLLITEKKAQISCEPLPVIEGNSSQLFILFSQLIGNSLKFSKKELPPVITIASRMLTADEVKKIETLNQKLSFCEISFKDNGIGFLQEFSEQIFLIFSRLQNAQKISGTGIGLAACKKIVLNHHGNISVTAKEHEGALFKVILPLSQE